MSILIKGLTAKELLNVFEWARTGANNCMIGHGVIATELPDHGDLIDRDAFIKVNREYLCKDCERRKGVKNGRKRTLYEIGGVPCRACGAEDMFEYLDDAPVFIPAERSEDETD